MYFFLFSRLHSSFHFYFWRSIRPKGLATVPPVQLPVLGIRLCNFFPLGARSCSFDFVQGGSGSQGEVNRGRRCFGIAHASHRKERSEQSWFWWGNVQHRICLTFTITNSLLLPLIPMLG